MVITENSSKIKSRNLLWNLFKVEWAYLLERRKLFVLSSILFLIAGAISLLNPLLIGLIFNSVQKSIADVNELKHLLFLILGILVLDIGFWIFHGFGRYIETRSGFFVRRNYTNSKIREVLQLPIKWHKDHHTGDTIDKINRSSSAIESFSSDMAYQIIYAFMNIFGSLAILFFVDYRIALFALVFSIIVLLIMFRLDKKLTAYYSEQNKIGNKVSAAVYDYIGNIFTIITLRMKKTVSKEIDRRIMAGDELSRKTSMLNESKWAFASISIGLMTVLALGYRAYSDFVSGGVILVGTMYILYGYLNNVGRTFYTFAELYGTLTRRNVSINNALPIEEEFKKVKDEVALDLPENWEEIELKNFNFSYGEEDAKRHIDGVNFKFRKGQKIALIGESGSGKSTVLSLLRGLYPPSKGQFFCNGQRIDHGFARLSKHITLIPQDPELFNNTVKYNITMDVKTSDVELDKVIRMAQFKKVVSRLDKGLETNVLEKGVSLSGGEKQRLALARGLLAARDSEIVLLDEPTSSVDSINEMAIHDNLFEEFADKTIISSIHRLHLLKKFDYVYMFEKGKIVAEGSLEEIKKVPKFMAIWKKYGLKGEIDGKK